jgi:hypothetical protein
VPPTLNQQHQWQGILKTAEERVWLLVGMEEERERAHRDRLGIRERVREGMGMEGPGINIEVAWWSLWGTH